MKRAFIIDLNILYLAALLKNETGEDDYSSKRLLLDILKYCNTLYIPKGYMDCYMKIIYSLKGNGVYINQCILRLWWEFLSIDGKMEYPDDEPSILEEEGQFHDDDKDFVRLAAYVDNRIVFATTNNRLRDKLNDLGMIDKYGFLILRPEDALKYVGNIE